MYAIRSYYVQQGVDGLAFPQVQPVLAHVDPGDHQLAVAVLGKDRCLLHDLGKSQAAAPSAGIVPKNILALHSTVKNRSGPPAGTERPRRLRPNIIVAQDRSCVPLGEQERSRFYLQPLPLHGA